MLLHVPNVLSAEQVVECRRQLAGADWLDGRVTAGHQSAQNKDNAQLPKDSPVARQFGQTILSALERNPLFLAGALPLKIFPPLFNRYAGGQSFGNHVDNAVRQVRNATPMPRPGCAPTLSAPYCSISIWPSSRLGADAQGPPALVQLTGVYHNLLRRWADAS